MKIQELSKDEQTLIAHFRSVDEISRRRLLAFVEPLPDERSAVCEHKKPIALDEPDDTNHEAKARLMEKLCAIGPSGIENMTDDAFGDFVDSLPFDEFLELIALGGDKT